MGHQDEFQVRVPAMNVAFIGYRSSGQLLFSPIWSRPDLGLEAGKTEPASKVLRQLQPVARKIDPSVPN